jgi:hypothetical protein
MLLNLDIETFVHRKTLIVGDVNTGKTTLAKEILELFCLAGMEDQVVVLDLAPCIPQSLVMEKGLKGVGGRLIPPAKYNVLSLSTCLKPPRLASKTEEESLTIARDNMIQIDRLLLALRQSARNILFVNDISLYLQAGNARAMMRQMENADTIVANGYLGLRLGMGEISRREREEMGLLVDFFDLVIRLPLSPKDNGN